MRDEIADLPMGASPDETVSCGVALLGRSPHGDAILLRVANDRVHVLWDLPTWPTFPSELRRQAATRIVIDTVSAVVDAGRVSIAPVFPSFFEHEVVSVPGTPRHRFVHAIAHLDVRAPMAAPDPFRWVPSGEALQSPPERWARSFLPTFVQAVAWRRGW